MKDCKACNKNTPLSEFYKDRSRKDGLSRICKPCDNKRRESFKKKGAYYRSEKYRKMRKRNGRLTYEKRQGALLRYYEKNKDHIAARSAVKRATKAGKLFVMPCEVFNVECDGRIEAHHHRGYAKENWLIVTWLCKEHHRQAHHEK